VDDELRSRSFLSNTAEERAEFLGFLATNQALPPRRVILISLGIRKYIHRWGFAFIAVGIALWMSGISPQLGSILFVIGLAGLVIAWVIR
jgi:hypothetical protein